MMLRPPLSWNSLRAQDERHDSSWVTVCGDIHLRPQQEDSFIQFLDELSEKSPHHLVILGDLFDYWLDSPSFVMEYDFLFRRLHSLSQQGWQLHCVLGNRELAAGPCFQKAFPGRVYLRKLDLETAAGRLRIVHGDRLVRDPGYRLMAAILSSWWFRTFQACAPLIVQQMVARWIRGKSQAKNRRVAEYGPPLQLLDPRRVAAASRGCIKLLAGHIHLQLERRIRGCAFTLCGHWDEDVGRWVTISSKGEVALQNKHYA